MLPDPDGVQLRTTLDATGVVAVALCLQERLDVAAARHLSAYPVSLIANHIAANHPTASPEAVRRLWARKDKFCAELESKCGACRRLVHVNGTWPHSLTSACSKLCCVTAKRCPGCARLREAYRSWSVLQQHRMVAELKPVYAVAIGREAERVLQEIHFADYCAIPHPGSQRYHQKGTAAAKNSSNFLFDAFLNAIANVVSE
jgi:hypothetical protein